MGNSQTLSCASGEKSSKAQQKDERYTKAPADKATENGTGASDSEAAGEPNPAESAEETSKCS